MEKRLPFHQQLRLERERRGWSQADLAKRMGKISVKTIRRWERGESLPQPYYRQKFIEVLGKSPEELGLIEQASESLSHKEDWGEAPLGNPFYGRENEQANLQAWMAQKPCRVIALVGIGGIGKTSLAATTAFSVKDTFSAIFWRSLRNAPPLEHFLQQCLQFLFFEPQPLPTRSDDLLSLLLYHLQAHRCLLVLDNFESLLQPGQSVGHYREGYEPYGHLLQQLGETRHQSCLLLTSREKPREITYLEGKNSPVRSLTLAGMGRLEGQQLLQEKDLSGSPEHWARLIEQYSGNPLALKLVAQPIHTLFAGNIASFLQEEKVAFGDITDLLHQQFGRLTGTERELFYWLAIEREAVTAEELQASLVHPLTKGALLTTLTSLLRRFLIEQHHATRFTLQPVIQEYVTDELIRQACEEFGRGASETWSSYAFLKAQAKEYLRESQKRLILVPIVQYLLDLYGQAGLERHIQTLLVHLRTSLPQRNSYIVGNVLNLLIFCGTNLSAFDFSHLPVRQAYLQDYALPRVNFEASHFRECVFTNTFGDILSVTWSPEGQLVAAGTSNGKIWLYSRKQDTLLGILGGHTDGVWAVAFSPDGRTIASGSDDQTVRLWDQETGTCLRVLPKHSNRVRAVSFSPDGRLLVSGGEDGLMHLWSMPDGELVRTLTGHTGRIWSIDFSPDGRLLASGGTDQTVRIWQVVSGECRTILSEHTHWVRSVRFSPNGCLLASASDDRTIRIWDCQQAAYKHTLQGHASPVWSLAFPPDSRTLVSGSEGGSEGGSLRLWDMESGVCRTVLQGHSRGIRAITIDPTGQWLVSGGEGQTIYLWDLSTGECTKKFRGYTNRIWCIDSSQSKNQLASCSEDGCIRLWDMKTGSCIQTLSHRVHSARCVAMQPGGTWLASSGEDQKVRIWSLTSGRCKHVLEGHATWVRTISFSPDGIFLATGGEDGIIYVWDMRDPARANQRRLSLHGHTNWIRSVAFQPRGELLASGSDDQTVRLWHRQTGQCIQTLQGHRGRVRGVAFHPNGCLLASGSEDGSIRLWDLTTWDCIAVLEGQLQRVLTLAFSPCGKFLASGSNDAIVHIWSLRGQTLQPSTVGPAHSLNGHTGQIRSVCFHANPPLLVSGSEDGTIKLWEVKDGPEVGATSLVRATCINTLISGRPYEGMNITKAQGLTEAQRLSLVALGAVDEGE